MSEEQINIAIAEVCNKVIVDKWGEKYPIPDFCNDLNAMHEAEKRLLSGYWMRYCECLNCLLGKSVYASVHATARDRAEAFLKTIGKWEDGE